MRERPNDYSIIPTTINVLFTENEMIGKLYINSLTNDEINYLLQGHLRKCFFISWKPILQRLKKPGEDYTLEQLRCLVTEAACSMSDAQCLVVQQASHNDLMTLISNPTLLHLITTHWHSWGLKELFISLKNVSPNESKGEEKHEATPKILDRAPTTLDEHGFNWLSKVIRKDLFEYVLPLLSYATLIQLALQPNKYGETPLHVAAKYRPSEAFMTLIKAVDLDGSELDALFTDKQGVQILHLAAEFQSPDLFMKLLNKLSPETINTICSWARKNDGRSLLAIAAAHQNIKVCKALFNTISPFRLAITNIQFLLGLAIKNPHIGTDGAPKLENIFKKAQAEVCDHILVSRSPRQLYAFIHQTLETSDIPWDFQDRIAYAIKAIKQFPESEVICRENLHALLGFACIRYYSNTSSAHPDYLKLAEETFNAIQNVTRLPREQQVLLAMHCAASPLTTSDDITPYIDMHQALIDKNSATKERVLMEMEDAHRKEELAEQEAEKTIARTNRAEVEYRTKAAPTEEEKNYLDSLYKFEKAVKDNLASTKKVARTLEEQLEIRIKPETEAMKIDFNYLVQLGTFKQAKTAASSEVKDQVATSRGLSAGSSR